MIWSIHAAYKDIGECRHSGSWASSCFFPRCLKSKLKILETSGLKTCVEAVAERKRQVPYRNHKLTQLLQDKTRLIWTQRRGMNNTWFNCVFMIRVGPGHSEWFLRHGSLSTLKSDDMIFEDLAQKGSYLVGAGRCAMKLQLGRVWSNFGTGDCSADSVAAKRQIHVHANPPTERLAGFQATDTFLGFSRTLNWLFRWPHALSCCFQHSSIFGTFKQMRLRKRFLLRYDPPGVGLEVLELATICCGYCIDRFMTEISL